MNTLLFAFFSSVIYLKVPKPENFDLAVFSIFDKNCSRNLRLICNKRRGRRNSLTYNYLCTYDLYGPVRNAFEAGSILYEGTWEGVGLWKWHRAR
jgi:hypothetical protein